MHVKYIVKMLVFNVTPIINLLSSVLDIEKIGAISEVCNNGWIMLLTNT